MSSVFQCAAFLFVFAFAPVVCTTCRDGECDSDGSILLQSKITMENMKAEFPYMTDKEIEQHKRLKSRQVLLIEQDLSALDSVHYTSYNRNKDIDENLRQTFEAFCATSGLCNELTPTEKQSFLERVIEDAKVLLKHAGFDETSPEHQNQWQEAMRRALEDEKPVCTQQLETATNNAQHEFTVDCKALENFSQLDFKKILGKKATEEGESLLQTKGPSSGNYQHMFDESLTPAASFDGRTGFPQCREVIERVHNQGTCGSCWVFGALSALDSRICIKTNGAFSGANAMLSRGYGASCALNGGNGCAGGLSRYAYNMFATDQAGVTGGNGGCSPYFGHGSAADHFNANEGSPPCPSQCSNSDGFFRTLEQDRFKMPSLQWKEIYRQEAVMISQMKQALSQNGPVPFGIFANSPFMGYSSGVFNGDCTAGANHEVVAIGYGTDPEEHVIGLNSWGQWGDSGTFKATWCTVTDFTASYFTETTANLPSPLFAGASPGPNPTTAPTDAPTNAPPTDAPTDAPTEAPEPEPEPTEAPQPTNAPNPNAPWNIQSGPCTVDSQGCVMSPNWDGNAGKYGNSEECTIAVIANSPQIEVVDFNVEAGYDKLFVNGARNDTPNGATPTQAMRWTSDHSVTDRGWKLCPKISAEPTVAPTEAPTTVAPTEAPEPPTDAPTTVAPTEAPTTEPPTDSPTTVAPTDAPTNAPTSEPPIPVTRESIAEAFRSLATEPEFLNKVMAALGGIPQ